MMKRLSALVLLVGLLWLALPAAAGSVTVNGSVSTAFGPFARPDNCGTVASGGVGDLVFGDTYTFTVDTTGTYTLTVTPNFSTNNNSFIVLYSPSFDSTSPLTNCLTYDNSGGNSVADQISVTLNAGTVYELLVSTFLNATVGSYSAVIAGPGNIAPYTPPVPTSTPASTASPPQAASGPRFTDGRINNDDAAAPVAVFSQDENGAEGLRVYSPDGVMLLAVFANQIAAVPDCPSTNTLIASGHDVFLYRLTSCEFQINTGMANGKLYTLIFDAAARGAGYHSFETP